MSKAMSTNANPNQATQGGAFGVHRQRRPSEAQLVALARVAMNRFSPGWKKHSTRRKTALDKATTRAVLKSTLVMDAKSMGSILSGDVKSAPIPASLWPSMSSQPCPMVGVSL
jgi:hypothetical protein